MAFSTWAAVVAGQILLVVVGLMLLLPPRAFRLPPGELRRRFRRYGPLLLAALLVLLVHLFEVRLDPQITALLGWDLTGAVHGLEGNLVPSLAAYRISAVTLVFALLYGVVHPWFTYFVPLYLVLTDEERPARMSLLAFPVLYGFTLPFFLLAPVQTVSAVSGVASPIFTILPGLSGVYQLLDAPTNAFPAFQSALALLLANAARGSRNPRLQALAWVYAPLMVIAPLYLGITWLSSVVAGILLAFASAVLIRRITDVERIVLQRVKPAPEEAQRLRESAEALLAAARDHARPLGAVDAVLVGSVAKETYLRDHVDLDVFVLFPPDVPRDDLEVKGLEVGYAVVEDGEENYAEHPYIRGNFRGLPADVVPAYRIADPAKRLSAVDRTPFHTSYVREHLERDQRDQVRLLKRFMKGVGVYGAEARIQGFSGYLCELLVLKFESFRGVLAAAPKWRSGTYLTLTTMDEPVPFEDALVFIDPVDPERNAASAVAGSTLERFVEAARAYAHRPRMSFFYPHQLLPRDPGELARRVAARPGEVLVVTLPRPEALEDHLWDQVRKARGALEGLLTRAGFDVTGGAEEVAPEHVLVLLEVADGTLPETEDHRGPPAFAGAHADRFRAKWTDHPEAAGPVEEQEGRLVVRRLRRVRGARELILAEASELDLGRNLNKGLPAMEVLKGSEAVRAETAMLLTTYLERGKPWQR